jgi:hypothetical protein
VTAIFPFFSRLVAGVWDGGRSARATGIDHVCWQDVADHHAAASAKMASVALPTSGGASSGSSRIAQSRRDTTKITKLESFAVWIGSFEHYSHQQPMRLSFSMAASTAGGWWLP